MTRKNYNPAADPTKLIAFFTTNIVSQPRLFTRVRFLSEYIESLMTSVYLDTTNGTLPPNSSVAGDTVTGGQLPGPAQDRGAPTSATGFYD
jgi:hypothetical protein